MGVYYSFDHERDAWRVRQVLDLDGVGASSMLSVTERHELEQQGDRAVAAWIESRMRFASAVVVLVGAETDRRRWVRHEVLTAWKDRRPLLGIRIHGLLDAVGQSGERGPNPFFDVKLRTTGGYMSDYVPLFEPEGDEPEAVLMSLKRELSTWLTQGYRRPW